MPIAGTVYLVGAGPGDPELITVRGLKLLRRADVVIHDTLISGELVDEVRAGAEVIDAGKRPRGQSYFQDQINAWVVGRARHGKTVVRLKGGDPCVFGRGGEELRACRDAGIECVVVPGVTSAVAAPAAAAIPLTLRETSRSFVVVTGCTNGTGRSHSPDYRALAAIDTVVVMMGRSNLSEVTQGLIDAGRSPTTPAACIERATTPQQRVTLATLATIAAAADRDGLRAPVVTVIGDTVAQAEAPASQSPAATNRWRRHPAIPQPQQQTTCPETLPVADDGSLPSPRAAHRPDVRSCPPGRPVRTAFR